MLSVIRMPQMGVSDESAILSKWLVREGDRVRKGQPIFSLETDKATFQCEAESDGILVRILTGEGEEAAVGSPVGIISDTNDFGGSELEALLKEAAGTEKDTQAHIQTVTNGPEKETAQDEKQDLFSAQVVQHAGRRISPRARKTANELGVNLNTIHSGSGPDGRILEQDVRNAAHPTQTGPVYEPKTCGIRSGRPLTIADRVSMRQVCVKGAGQTGFVSRLVDVRKILAQCTPQNKLAPGEVVCHELAQILVRTPEINSRRHGDKIYEYNTVHLRLNVETPFGTLKPVIRCAEAYTSDELAALMHNAAGRCKRFASKPQEFQEGTFTVADLSGYGVDSFTPELTPPELCALGIGAVTMQAKTDERGGIMAYPAIRLTLVYDRAGIDVIRAARFLNELALMLEQH